MAVMFFVPYDYNLYDNWHAVGIFGIDRTCNYPLYLEMLDEPLKGFMRSKAGDCTLKHKEGDITIKSTMTDESQSVLTVEVSSVGH